MLIYLFMSSSFRYSILHSGTKAPFVSHHALDVLITVLSSCHHDKASDSVYFSRKAHSAVLFIIENVRTFTLPLIVCLPILAYAHCSSNNFIPASINTSTLWFHNACKQKKAFTLFLLAIIDLAFSFGVGWERFQLQKKNAYSTYCSVIFTI